MSARVRVGFEPGSTEVKGKESNATSITTFIPSMYTPGWREASMVNYLAQGHRHLDPSQTHILTIHLSKHKADARNQVAMETRNEGTKEPSTLLPCCSSFYKI